MVRVCLYFTVGSYLIASGREFHAPDHRERSTEVVDLANTDSTLSFGKLPFRRYGAVGAMFGNAPMLCGGGSVDRIIFYDSCISFQNSQWNLSHSMMEKRQNAAGVQINSNTFWILGGSSTTFNLLDSTEFIVQGQSKGVPGPKLPYGLQKSCVVKLSEYEIFVIGGGSPFKKEVWIYNPQNDFSRKEGPSLTTAREEHCCSTMRDGENTFIIVAGGKGPMDNLISVEIYDPTDLKWHSG